MQISFNLFQDPKKMDRFYGLEQEEEEEIADDDDEVMAEELGSNFLFNEHLYGAAHRLQLVLKDVFAKNVEMVELRKVKFRGKQSIINHFI